MLLVFTVVLMMTLNDWQSEAELFHPLALANLIAAAVAIGLAVIRPAPLVLCILLVLTFGGPWIFAVLRRAVLSLAADE